MCHFFFSPSETLEESMAEEYFAQHDIQGMLDKLVKDLAESRPDDPKEFIAQALGNVLCQPCDQEYFVENNHPKWFNPAAMKGA